MLNDLKLPVAKILDNIERVIVGKRAVAELSLIALLAKGHVLLEDVPGVGKTMLVKVLAKSLGVQYKRIQFTPDLLPSDVIGVSVFNPKDQEFKFHPGPIMGNIILADEINRTSPKTQSALLEAMEEHAVTVDGVTRVIHPPFFVMATQNPIEYEGTYTLPEAQLDRFLLKIRMGYPSQADEITILQRAQTNKKLSLIESILSIEDLLYFQEQAGKIFVDEIILRYITELVVKTRKDKHTYLGVSPRGSIALMKAAQALAFIRNRDFVIPDDVQYLAPFVLSHRIILNSEANYNKVTAEAIIRDIVIKTPVPTKRV